MRKLLLLASGAALFLAGCHTDMWVQPRHRPLTESTAFSDGLSSRVIPANTVPRGFLREDTQYYTGRDDAGAVIQEIPLEQVRDELGVQTMKEVVLRGQEMFNAFCSPCHGRLGNGEGMIAERGLNLKRKPASYHDPKIVAKADGHYFDVITNGFGIMFPYKSRIEPADRWAIVAYIRALQEQGAGKETRATRVQPERGGGEGVPSTTNEVNNGGH